MPHENKDANIFAIGEYNFDFEQLLLQRGAHAQKLTAKEAELLRLLCLHINEVLEREVALKLIWGEDSYFNARSMDVYITKLRKYLKDDSRIEIRNVHGRGFRLMIKKSP
jgi:DNA-binding response OmpR family regulator